MRKTNNKWSTESCPRCKQSHSNYTGKLDANNIEYVVCGITNKRINVPNEYFNIKIKELKNKLGT